MTSMPGSAAVERFRAAIAARLGLSFDDSKLALLADLLQRRLPRGQDGAAYLRDLEERPAPEELAALARELTVGETYFFRHFDQFRAFREIALPDRCRARDGERRLRILSAGCSSGEEAYSLAILVREAGLDPSWQVSIRAVDINPAALQKAAQGRVTTWALRETPPDLQARWFVRSGRDLALAPEIQSAVSFESRNLVEDDPELWPAGGYDIVFCRNVIMYFTPEQLQAVVARFGRALAPGGFLFVGHAETLRGLTQDFHLRHTHDTFYYQRRLADDAPARPSAFEAWRLPRAAMPRPAPEMPPEAERAAGWAWADEIGRASARIHALGRAAAARPQPARLPEAPTWSLVTAFDLLQRERFSEALALVRALPEAAADDPDVLLLTAVLLVHSGESEAAAAMASRLLAVDEFNAGAHYVLALGDEAQGDVAGAVNHNQVAAYLDPAFAMPRLRLGLLARRSGDRDAARRHLGQALLLFQREDPSRILLFGGGFKRDSLIALCRAELAASGGKT